MNHSSTAQVIDLLAACALGLCLGWFTGRRSSTALQAAKLATLKATMRTVQLIVNNFFNTLLMVELELKDDIKPETLVQLERGMQETFQQLTALGDLEVVTEVPFATGSLVAYPHQLVQEESPGKTAETTARVLGPAA